MLECRACVGRAIRVIAGDGAYATALATRPLALTPHLTVTTTAAAVLSHQQRRRLATAAETRESSVQTPPFDAPSGLAPIEKPTRVSHSPKLRGDAIAIANEKAVRQQLGKLKDPIKLAQHVEYALRCGHPDSALDLCRRASRNMSCTVAWNHILAWHMEKHQVSKAMDIYNEMKKRGQFPDSYTYMRLLTGFTENKGHTAKAVSIYYSMSSPTSRVKTSIMHTNAALRLCALTKDMDALWGIASKLPERGPNAPDAVTYTTILQAIRHSSMGDEADPAMMWKLRQDAVNEGRRIWQEIIAKWRAGKLVIDEKLVAAMANLLLISRRMADWDDVLNLVLQTTRIERLVAPLGDAKRQTGHVRVDGQLDPKPHSAVEEDHEGFMPTPSARAFMPVTPIARTGHQLGSSSLAWVCPGNSILSVLIRACSMMQSAEAANRYWDILTSEPYNVAPDTANFHTLLRLLRVNRSAQRAAHVLYRMHNEAGVPPTASTYQMAMSVCARDHKNPNIVNVATTIIDDMGRHLENLDMNTLEMYLSIALTTNNGPSIGRALNRILAFNQVRLRQAKNLYQAMIGSVDTLLSRNLVVGPQAEEYWQQKRRKLDGLLSISKFKLTDKRRFEEQGWRGYGLAARPPAKRSTISDELSEYQGRDEKLKAERMRPPTSMDGVGGALARFQRSGNDERQESQDAQVPYNPWNSDDRPKTREARHESRMAPYNPWKTEHGFADLPGELDTYWSSESPPRPSKLPE